VCCEGWRLFWRPIKLICLYHLFCFLVPFTELIIHTTYNFFQVSLKAVVYLVIVFYVSTSIALTSFQSTPYRINTPQHTEPRPYAHPFLGNSYGSVHSLGNNILPNNVIRAPPLTKVKVDQPVKTTRRNNVKQPSSKVPTNFRDNYDTPILFPGSYFPSRNQHEQNTNAWFEGGGIEQRMLLPRGYSIPEEMYGPNYIWDTKGWPRLINTTPKPIYNRLKGSTRNKVSYDSPIIFPDNPSFPVHILNMDHPQPKRL
jgi:hypothetical protein